MPSARWDAAGRGTQRDLEATLRDVSEAAEAIRSLAEALERDPDMLLKGKTKGRSKGSTMRAPCRIGGRLVMRRSSRRERLRAHLEGRRRRDPLLQPRAGEARG